jgi:hypothetical protein
MTEQGIVVGKWAFLHSRILPDQVKGQAGSGQRSRMGTSRIKVKPDQPDQGEAGSAGSGQAGSWMIINRRRRSSRISRITVNTDKHD